MRSCDKIFVLHSKKGILVEISIETEAKALDFSITTAKYELLTEDIHFLYYESEHKRIKTGRKEEGHAHTGALRRYSLYTSHISLSLWPMGCLHLSC